MSSKPFSLPYSQEAVDDLRDRLRRTRWPDEIPDAAWEYGFDRSFLQDLCLYWQDSFDWKSQLDRLSAFHHYRDANGIHFIHEPGKGPRPMPLIITHGWPGSFIEMTRIIPMLTDPAAHGGDSGDAFDVVVPSMPGYGFSDRPTSRGMSVFRVAELWTNLMHDLGYERFAAQGGDIGAAVTIALGMRHADRLTGIHLNFIFPSYRPYLETGAQLAPPEEEYMARVMRWAQEDGAYAHLQATRPQTPAYGLNDSPAGLAAWIVEKFREWSDCDGDVYRRFTRDELLSNVTLYWMTQTIHSSFRIYLENRKAPLQLASGDFIKPPCAVALFPKEIPMPPRQWVERGFNLQRWTEMPRGGHFAAMEEPELLAGDIRTFFRSLR